jgi:hypothetical protein
MEKSRIGLLLDLIGVLLFLISLLVLLPLGAVYYVISLLGMFTGIVSIAIGIALPRGVGKSLEHRSEDCYYCKGSGKVNRETCPRCGGTGFAPADA